MRVANQDGGTPRVHLQQETGTPQAWNREGRGGQGRMFTEPHKSWRPGSKAPWWEMEWTKVYKAGRQQRSSTITLSYTRLPPTSYRWLP